MGLMSIAGGMRAVNALLTAAEARAVALGAEETAAEHIVLAALDAGGSATAAFARVGLAPDAFRQALASGHAEALRSLGIVAPEILAADPSDIAPGRGRYRMAPSGRRLFERVAAHRGARNAREALGAQVVLALTEIDGGAAADARDRLGVPREDLAEAARAEIAAA